MEVLRDAEAGEPAIPEVLAYHLTEAGAFPEAIEAWLRAGVGAARRSAHVEAVEHIRNGLGLLDQIPDPGARRQFELNLQASLMGSLLATQSATSSELAACCERGLQLCEECAAAPMVFPFAFGQFTFVNCRGRSSEAISLAREFVSRAERGGFESERVIGHRMLGQALLAQGDAAAAKTALERSLALYVDERDAATTHLYGQNTEVHTKSLLSLTHLCLGDVDARTRGRPRRAADGRRVPASAFDRDPDGLCRRLGVRAVRGHRADDDGGEEPSRAGRAASTLWISRARGRFHGMGALPARAIRSRASR